MKWSVCILVVFLAACSKQKNEKTYFTNIMAVSGPSEGERHKNVVYNLDVSAVDGCGAWAEFITQREGNRLTIRAVMHNEGEACTMMPKIVKSNYIFKTHFAGTYILEFYNYNQLITDTLVIH